MPRTDVWASLQAAEELVDTPAEAEAFDAAIRAKMLAKWQAKRGVVSDGQRATGSTLVDALSGRAGVPEAQDTTSSTALVSWPPTYDRSGFNAETSVMPSFNPGSIQHFSTPHLGGAVADGLDRSGGKPRLSISGTAFKDTEELDLPTPRASTSTAQTGQTGQISEARSSIRGTGVRSSRPSPRSNRGNVAATDQTPTAPPLAALQPSPSPAPYLEEPPSRTIIISSTSVSPSKGINRGKGVDLKGKGKQTDRAPPTAYTPTYRGDTSTQAPHIASPIDTPTATRSGLASGSGASHTTATRQHSALHLEPPTPLGNTKLRGKSLLSLTKHFEAFSKTLPKSGESDSGGRGGRGGRGSRGGRGVGRGAGGQLQRAPTAVNAVAGTSDTEQAGAAINADSTGDPFISALNNSSLPSGPLRGCRVCVVPDVGGASRAKQRWDIITKMGGTVILEPDTALTHVIYDGKSPVNLARDLGLTSVDDLPEECVVVKWDWVASSKMAGKKLDPAPWLTFRDSAQPNRSRSRLIDITDQLKTGGSTGVRKRRGATASDSETESSKPLNRPKRVRSSPVLQVRRLPTRTSSTPVNYETGRGPSASSGRSLERTKAQLLGHDADSSVGAGPSNYPGALQTTVNTVHGPAVDPIWGPDGVQDGLDIMISGVQSGKVETLPDDVEEDDEGNPCVMGDRFKCGQVHNGTTKVDTDKHPNEWLAKKFDEMHEMYSGSYKKNDWQVRGYRNAAAIMRRTRWAILSGEDARKIKGIGDSIQERIDEFISGRKGRQYYDMDEQMGVVSSFAKIYGVGKAQANDLYTRGARTIADLAAPGNPYNLTSGQMTGVELYDDLNTRIPRAECKEIFEQVKVQAKRVDPRIWIEIMGSYRRGQENSGDVDILITRNTEDGRTHVGALKGLIGRLVDGGIITHQLSLPSDWNELEAKWMGVCKLPGGLHRRIDIMCIPFHQWGAALLYFTGNDIFNRSMRLYARKMGYSLNQRGLSKGVMRGKDGLKFTEGEIVASRTEQEIFDMLGLKWRVLFTFFHRPPQQRRP